MVKKSQCCFNFIFAICMNSPNLRQTKFNFYSSCQLVSWMLSDFFSNCTYLFGFLPSLLEKPVGCRTRNRNSKPCLHVTSVSPLVRHSIVITDSSVYKLSFNQEFGWSIHLTVVAVKASCTMKMFRFA